MEQRKLIRLGNSSFAIALPKDWVDKSSLKKGDDVFIERNGNGEIVISPSFKKATQKEISLDLKDKEETMLHIALIKPYLQNFGIFKIKNNLDSKKISHIKELVKNLMSFEVIEENKDEIKLKDVFNMEEVDILGFIRRIDNILRSFFEDIQSTLSSRMQKKICEEMKISDKEITKIYLLIGRIFMKSLENPSLLSSLKLNSKDIFRYWWIALHMEKIGDDIKRIAELMGKHDKSLPEDIQKYFKLINDNYFICLNSFHQKNMETTKKIISENKKIIYGLENLEKKDAVSAQISEKLKSMQGNIFQISKMDTYLN